MLLKNHLYELILQVHKNNVNFKSDKTEISQLINETDNKILIKKLESDYLLSKLKTNKSFVAPFLEITNKYRKKDTVNLYASLKDSTVSFINAIQISVLTFFIAILSSVIIMMFSVTASKIVMSFFSFFIFCIFLTALHNTIIYKKCKRKINNLIKSIDLKDLNKSKIDYNLKVINELELAEKDPNNNKFYDEIKYIKEFIVNEAFDFKDKNENEKENILKKEVLYELEKITDEKAKYLFSDLIETKLIKENKLTDEEKALQELFKIELTIEDKINILKKIN